MTRTGIGLVAVALGVGAPCVARGYEFSKVVETGVVTGGVNVNFGDLGPPVLDGDSLAFCGQSFVHFGKNGIYRADLSPLAVVALATDSTPSPSGGGNFSGMCITGGTLPSIDDGDVAFTAASDSVAGVYEHDGSSLRTIVDQDTVFPATTATPRRWDSPSRSGRIAVTWSNSPEVPYFSGVYSFDLGRLFAVADANVTDDTAFFNVSQGTVAGSGAVLGLASYVWLVNDSPSGPHRVYRRRYDPLGPVELIASTNQEIAGGKFVASPGFPQADRSQPDKLCFLGGAPISAVYRYSGTEVQLVADLTTPIPGGTGTFTGFGLWCAIDAGDVVFQGSGSAGQSGVYISQWLSGQLEPIADTHTTLGGGTPSLFQVSREAISDGRVAFEAYVAGEASIWVTPEPGALLAGAAAFAALAAVQRLRGAGFARASRRAINASTL